MTATYIIAGGIIDKVVYDDVELTENAETGAIGEGHVTVRDDDGTIDIIGLKNFIATENDCSAEKTLYGIMGQRTFSRGTAEVANARFINATVQDRNALLGLRALRGADAKRPRETINARLTWLLATPELGDLVEDHGRVSYPSTIIDKADHRKTYPGDVLAECAVAAGGFNYYVYTDETTGDASLTFRDDNASTANTSILRISNDHADLAVSSNTLYPSDDVRLTRDPGSVYSKVAVPYANGTAWRESGATASNYRRRDGIAPTAHAKSRTRANAIGDAYLATHNSEEDIIDCPIPQVRSDQINLVHAGDRIAAKFTHLTTEGYGTFTYFRVLERKVRPLLRDIAPAVYEMDLRLSPQETCSVQPTFVQYNIMDAALQPAPAANWTWRLSLDAPSTVGNLLVLDIVTNNTAISVPTGWTAAIPINTDPGASSFNHTIWYKKSAGETYVDSLWSGSSLSPRGLFIEYAGLINPVLSGSAITKSQTGLGYADIDPIPYPSGASAVLAFCNMDVGPESGDALAVSGTNHTLRTPQDSDDPGFLGAPCLSVGDYLRTGSSGTATGWQVQFTNDEPTYTVGLVFVGETC